MANTCRIKAREKTMKHPSEFTLGEISSLMRVLDHSLGESDAVSVLLAFAERWRQHEGEYTRRLLAEQEARRMKEHKLREEYQRKQAEERKRLKYVYFSLED